MSDYIAPLKKIRELLGAKTDEAIIISPFLILLFFCVVGALAFFFHLPERTVLTAVILFFALITILHPFNGLFFVLLSAPFFLGESGAPYYWLTELFIYGTLFSYFAKSLLAKNLPAIGFKSQLAFLILISALSAPIGAREFYYQFWSGSLKDILLWWLAAHPFTASHYFRILGNLVSGAALMIMAADFVRRSSLARAESLLSAAIVEATLVCFIGAMMFYDVIPRKSETLNYLSLSLVGKFGSSITAFAYALHYLGQYLCLLFPVAVYLLVVKRKSVWCASLYILAIGAILFTVFQGGLRTAAGSVILASLTMAAWIGFSKGKIGAGRLPFKAYFALFLIMILAGYGFSYTAAFDRLTGEITGKLGFRIFEHIGDFADDPLYFTRYGIWEPRLFLWHTALRMFSSSPALGVGLGRYVAEFGNYFASDYYNFADIGFASLAGAHSFYFATIAEQGIVGIFAWFLFLFSIITCAGAFIKKSENSHERFLAMALLLSLFIWLALSITHTLFLCRMIEILFWILLGLLVGVTYSGSTKLVIPGAAVKIFAATAILAFPVQLYKIYARPLPADFNTGFFPWQKVDGDFMESWTGKRAIFTARTIGGNIKLALSFPIPASKAPPQRVTVSAADFTKTVIVGSGDPAIIDFNAGPAPDHSVIVWIETDRTVNPMELGLNRDDHDLGVLVTVERKYMSTARTRRL